MPTADSFDVLVFCLGMVIINVNNCVLFLPSYIDGVYMMMSIPIYGDNILQIYTIPMSLNEN